MACTRPKYGDRVKDAPSKADAEGWFHMARDAVHSNTFYALHHDATTLLSPAIHAVLFQNHTLKQLLEIIHRAKLPTLKQMLTIHRAKLPTLTQLLIICRAKLPSKMDANYLQCQITHAETDANYPQCQITHN